MTCRTTVIFWWHLNLYAKIEWTYRAITWGNDGLAAYPFFLGLWIELLFLINLSLRICKTPSVFLPMNKCCTNGRRHNIAVVFVVLITWHSPTIVSCYALKNLAFLLIFSNAAANRLTPIRSSTWKTLLRWMNQDSSMIPLWRRLYFLQISVRINVLRKSSVFAARLVFTRPF